MATTANLGSTKPLSEQDAQKVATYNGLADDYDGAIAGYLSASIAGAAGDTLLSRTQALNKFIKLTGAITGNRTVTIPSTGGYNRRYVIWNNTSGAFTVGIRIGSGTAVLITQGKARDLFHDGTTVYVGPEFDPANGSLASSIGALVTSFTPTVTPQTGSITTSSAVCEYVRLSSQLVWIRLVVIITTNGTGAGYIDVSLPFTTPNDYNQALAGADTDLTGKDLAVRLLKNTTIARFVFYDNSYPGANGAALTCQGTYRTV